MSAVRPAVLLVGNTLGLGGTEGQVVEVACGLSRARWDTRVACIKAEGPLRARLEKAEIPAWSCGPGSFKSANLVWKIFSLARYLRAHRIRLVHSFDLYSNVLAVPAARLAGVAVIASQRDMGDVRSPARRFANNTALRAATAVLVNAEAIRARLESAHVVPTHRMVVIRNGVDLARFSCRSRPLRTDRAPIIGTLAVLRPEKGLDTLLRAAALMTRAGRTAEFVMWGDGPLRTRLEALAKELGVHTVTRFAGRTTCAPSALNELDIFVLPPRSNEGLSNALLEAMAMGLPVVATRVGGNPELIEHDRTGVLVPPDEPAELARAITRLVDDPRFARCLGDRAAEHVRSEYGMPRMLQRVEDLYERVLTGVRIR